MTYITASTLVRVHPAQALALDATIPTARLLEIRDIMFRQWREGNVDCDVWYRWATAFRIRCRAHRERLQARIRARRERNEA